jgi:hypothetical protein
MIKIILGLKNCWKILYSRAVSTFKFVFPVIHKALVPKLYNVELQVKYWNAQKFETNWSI